LPTDLNAYLKDGDNWLEYLEEFRNAIAHRIPIYIPPFFVNPADEELNKNIETQLFIARKTDAAKFEKLIEQQSQIREFRPYYLHSIEESTGTVTIHSQLLVDFLTIYEISINLFNGLPINNSKSQTFPLKSMR